jgi:hypothetical protein
VMKHPPRIIATLAIAAIAYAAGRAGWLGDTSGRHALANPTQPPAAQVPPEAQARIEFATPGPNHLILSRLLGEWDGQFTVRAAPDDPGLTGSGIVRREWVLGGRFVRETVTADGDMGAFEGIGYIGFDNFDGHYVMVWMDTMSTAVQLDTGILHPDEQVIHSRASYRDVVSGRLINAWGKLDLSDPDRHLYTGNATDVSGRTFKAMEGVLTRRQ